MLIFPLILHLRSVECRCPGPIGITAFSSETAVSLVSTLDITFVREGSIPPFILDYERESYQELSR
jgi:hypothetical protein